MSAAEPLPLPDAARAALDELAMAQMGLAVTMRSTAAGAVDQEALHAARASAAGLLRGLRCSCYNEGLLILALALSNLMAELEEQEEGKP
jgi:hypothetical protein